MITQTLHLRATTLNELEVEFIMVHHIKGNVLVNGGWDGNVTKRNIRFTLTSNKSPLGCISIYSCRVLFLMLATI